MNKTHFNQKSEKMKYKQEEINYSKKQIKNKQKSPHRSISPDNWMFRYRELHSQYLQLLQEVKEKKHEHQMQKRQIQLLRLDKQRDQKELFRLRSMLGFIDKEDVATQVNIDMESGSSWLTKTEKMFGTDNMNQLSLMGTKSEMIKSPKRRSSNSPKYQQLKYRESPKSSNLAMSKTSKTLFRYKNTNKTVTEKKQSSPNLDDHKTLNNEKGRTYRTQSMIDSKYKNWKASTEESNKQKQWNYNPTNTHKKYFFDKSKRVSSDQLQQNAKLSNSPYSKIYCLKKKCK